MSPSRLRELLETWQSLRRDPGALDRTDAVALARDALALAHPSLACEILRLAGGDAPEARYLAALAHARVGDLDRALALATALLEDHRVSALHEEALALTGRIAKDRWRRLPDGPASEAALRQAIEGYRSAWERGGGMFPGINAASLLWIAGAVDEAMALARRVREAAAREIEAAPHWREATLGEAALLLGDAEAAASHYARARALAKGNLGDLASMRRQLRMLGRRKPVPQEVWSALAPPRIVVFTGHMLDAPGCARPRLPEAAVGPLAACLKQRLEALGAGIGYCSAACGADLLFVEAMLELGAEVHLTLPFARDDFLATSVAFAGPGWVDRFERALTRAASVAYGVQERFLGDESLFAHAGRLMQGAALLRGEQLESTPLLLAVLAEDAELKPGGTRDLLENWTRLGLPSECIDPAGLIAAIAPETPRETALPIPQVQVRSHPLRRQVRTMLFADMVGFSRLDEEDTPSFLLHFLGAVAGMLRDCGSPPSMVNTWGDGFFMVFDEVAAGVEFALRMRDAVASEDWPARGLPRGTSLRVGMHVGPVFEAIDPIVGRPSCFGSHVVRAARIEPVAAPGAVYASAELACALAASGARGFAADYLGVLPLAKGYGDGALYRLRRSHEAE